MTVSQAFSDFNTNYVNLIKGRSTKAKESRKWLYEQLMGFENKAESDFPFGYSGMHIDYGSFSRSTKIRELDDVDLMFCFAAGGATYRTMDNNIFEIETANAHERLTNLSDDRILNSRKVVNHVAKYLSQVSQYSKADSNRRGEAATLDLISYEWKFDITPCFYTDTGIYLVPDTRGNWKPSDPRIDHKRVLNSEGKINEKLTQLIRTLKYWNRHNSSYTINSYLFENFVINYSRSIHQLSDYIDYDIRGFFYYFQSAVTSRVLDPQGFQYDINHLTLDQKVSISNKANWAYNKAREAIDLEFEDKDLCLKKWKEVFGNNFIIH